MAKNNRDQFTPTLELARQLQTAFDYFNEGLFNGELPPALVSLHTQKKAKGFFLPGRMTRNKRKDTLHFIALNPETMHKRSIKETLGTLVHEMCHLKIEVSGKGPTTPYHCKEWASAMREIGLEPIVVNAKGEPTGKETGRNATHEIISGGLFCTSADELIDEGFDIDFTMLPEPKKVPKKKGKKKKTKFTYKCTGACDCSVEGKAGLHIHCADCDEPMKMEKPEPEEGEGETDQED